MVVMPLTLHVKWLPICVQFVVSFLVLILYISVLLSVQAQPLYLTLCRIKVFIITISVVVVVVIDVVVLHTHTHATSIKSQSLFVHITLCLAQWVVQGQELGLSLTYLCFLIHSRAKCTESLGRIKTQQRSKK